MVMARAVMIFHDFVGRVGREKGREREREMNLKKSRTFFFQVGLVYLLAFVVVKMKRYFCENTMLYSSKLSQLSSTVI